MSRAATRKTTYDRSMAIRAAPKPRPPLHHDSSESNEGAPKQKSSPGKKDGKKNSEYRVTATDGKLFPQSGPNTSSAYSAQSTEGMPRQGFSCKNRKQSGQNNSTRASNVQPNESEVAVGQQSEADPCEPVALDDPGTAESVSDASATSPTGVPDKAAELSWCRGIHGDGGSSAKPNQMWWEIFIQGLLAQQSGVLCLIMVLVISAVALLVFRGSPEHSVPGDAYQKRSDFAEKLRQQFPEEERRFVSMVTAVYKAVQREPARPAVLLLLSNDTSEDGTNTADRVAVCLARFIENELTQKSTIIIRGADFYKSDGDRSKYDIDMRLKAHFSKQARVAALTGIEKLSLQAATVFYKYCDHENSEHKNVVLVLTALVQNAAVDNDDAIKSTLLKSWQAVPDQVAPILSRVANNVLWPRSSRGLDCSVH